MSTNVLVHIPAPRVVPYLTEERLSTVIADCEEKGNWSQLIRLIGSVYNNAESLLLSFRPAAESPSKEELRAMETDADKDQDEKEMETDSTSAASPLPGPSQQQHARSKVRLKPWQVSLDLSGLRRAYSKLFAIPDLPFQPALINALIYLSRSISMELRYDNAYVREPDYLNIFLLIMEIPQLHSPEFIESATPLFCQALGTLPLEGQVRLARIWSRFSCERVKQFVDCLQQLITVKVISSQWQRVCVNDDDGITGAARVLKILYYASILGGDHDPPEVIHAERLTNQAAADNLQELLQSAVGMDKDKAAPRLDPFEKELAVSALDCRVPMVPWEDFVNEPLSEQIEMDKDYANYRNEKEAKFSFMTHSFLLTTAAKNLGMYYENRIRMISERRASLLQSLLRGASSMPYLRLRIRRDHIIDDALVAVSEKMICILGAQMYW